MKEEADGWRERAQSVSMEKESLSERHESLKLAVSEMTTQLRIMTRRYNKMRSKNEEYRKHFESTLNVQMAKQQDTIRNYHHQLTSIKEKYDILYAQYLEKGQVIASWQSKYDRLTRDFDQFIDGDASGHGQNGHHRVRPSVLVQRCKVMERRAAAKDERLRHLASMIGGLYQDVLPLIAGHLEDDDAHHDAADGDHDAVGAHHGDHHHDDRRRHSIHRDEDRQRGLRGSEEDDDGDSDGDDESSSGEEEEERRRPPRFLTVQHREIATPPNSYDDDVDDDERIDRERLVMRPAVYHSAASMDTAHSTRRESLNAVKAMKLKMRSDSHLNDHDQSDHEEEAMADSDDDGGGGRRERGGHRLDRLERGGPSADSMHLTVSKQLNVGSISDISIDDDGIDERDDDELDLQPIKLTAKAIVSSGSVSAASPVSNLSANGGASSVPSPGGVSKVSSTASTTKKKRRRSWVMKDREGPIMVTSADGQQTAVLQTSHSEPVQSEERARKNGSIGDEDDHKNASSASTASSSSTESMQVAPSPAPPPPPSHVVLQGQRQQESARSTKSESNQYHHSLEDE